MEDRKRAWAIFGVMSVMYCFSHFFRVSTALIAVDLTAEFGLGPGGLSFLGGAFFYAFAAAQLPLGPALDRLGARRMVLLGACVGALGSLVFGLAPGVEGLVAGRVLLGLGMAPILMGSLKLFADWFPPAQFGTVSGLVMALGTGGSLLAATPLAGLVAWLGWRGTFGLFAALTLAGAVAIAWVVQDGSPAPEEGSGPAAGGLFAGWAAVLRLPSFWAMAPLALVGYASVAGIQGLWAGPYFMEGLGYSRVETGHILFSLGLFGVVGSAVAGVLSDRWLKTRKWAVFGGNLAAVLLMLPLVGIGTPTSPLGWQVVFGALGLFGAFRFLLYAHVKESVPRRYAGSAVTAVNFFIMVGPALMQQAMGAVLAARPGDYRAAFAVPVVAVVVGAVLYLWTRDTHPSRAG